MCFFIFSVLLGASASFGHAHRPRAKTLSKTALEGAPESELQPMCGVALERGLELVYRTRAHCQKETVARLHEGST